ncbi:Uncharacterised protein [uncultured archaeon]|nr:Uncharacterised protein [uncultured archaeon]
MSHISIWKLALKNIDKALLIAAIKALASELGYEITTEISLGLHNFDIAMKSTNLRNGIAFRATQEGGVEIVGDSWGQKEEYNRISQLAPSFINAYKATQIAKNKNPNSQTKLKIEGTNVLVALELNV